MGEMKEYEGFRGMLRLLRREKKVALLFGWMAYYYATVPNQYELMSYRIQDSIQQDLEDEVLGIDPKFRRRPFTWEKPPVQGERGT